MVLIYICMPTTHPALVSFYNSTVTSHTLEKQRSSTSHLRSLSEAIQNSGSNISLLYVMTQISSACMHSKHLSKVSDASLSPEENLELSLHPVQLPFFSGSTTTV